MKKRTLITTLMVAAALSGGTLVPVVRAHADTVTQTTSSSSSRQTSTTHTISKSYVVYGSGAPESVYSNLNSTMGVDSSFTKLTATASDYEKYIGNGTTTNAAMISSVAIAPSDPGSGVRVNIKKYDGESNITEVTAQQYAMVAQMAGVTDVTIVVTANRAVSGESALTGVYKALAADGQQLDSQNTSAANQVLDATQGAINENSGDSSYPGKLMAAVGNVSKQVAKDKQNGQTDNFADIQALLTKALQKQGIESKTSSSSQTTIVNALITFRDSPISNSKTYVNNVTNTINNVKNSTGDLMNKAKNWANSEAAKTAVKDAQNWFQKLIAWIQNLFNN
ncbi:MAG: DUF1002 domain-containing protein [Limosilactobacillus gorillae]|uniref:DUF1002 domain-containing protein n=1 Tax=Limosilactobacillus gorillae TaxID=1450649 RepID=UPI000ABC8CC1|nr:DUF1002 domain-containing protein [Limosilactobacillus gorillae]MDO4855419.1 DUF1002 domain-containing protein [Limosilactobacillus gorillae]